MWWTVKHWSLSFDFYQFRDLSSVYEEGDFTLIEQSVSLTTKNGLKAGSSDYVMQATNEQSLVCYGADNDYEIVSRYFTWDVTLSRQFRVNGNTGTTAITQQAFLYTNHDSQQIGFESPFFKIQNTNNFWVALSAGFGNWSSFQAQGGPTAQGKFSLLGATRSFGLSHQELDAITTETLTNLSVTPDEFWPYNLSLIHI